jgi:poly(A) polymerase
MADVKRQFACSVVQRLHEAGHTALWAGGCVRDLCMGNPPQDYDVATDAAPEAVQRLFRRTLAVGASFGVVIVVGRRAEGQIEVATFRSEGEYSDGRHPDHVEFSTPQADAQRRDFTINGMFYDPLRQRLLDYVGGQEDLKRRVIRAIGDPRERFREDKLRLLRAIRFAARFGFDIEPNTAAALAEMADQIGVVSAERIQQELRRLLVDSSRVRALRLADACRLLNAILPEVTAMHGVPQDKPVLPGGDLWDHSLLVMEKLDESWHGGPLPFSLALGALLHDVGKRETMAHDGTKYTFHHHEHAGQRIAQRITRRLKLSNEERARVEWLVEFHMYLGEAKLMRLAKLKRTLVHEGIRELLALHRADALASTGNTEHVDYCEWQLRELSAVELNPPPFVTGHDLVRLGLDPGPLFKTLLEQVRDAQLDRTVRSKKEALAFLGRLLQEKGGAGAETE